MYRMMAFLRRFEEKAGQAYGQKKIQGFCHLYIGQEAVAVGAQYALEPDDYMMTGYRDHAHPIARGADPGMIMAELFGRYGGGSKRRGGAGGPPHGGGHLFPRCAAPAGGGVRPAGGGRGG